MPKYFFKYLDLIEKYFKDPQLSDTLFNMWTESHRYWHGLNHISFILRKLESKKKDIPTTLFEKLVIAAYFHDVIYFPDRLDNEEKSVEFLMKQPTTIKKDFIAEIASVIKSTKENVIPKEKGLKLFWLIDNDILYNGSFIDMINYEKQIFKEYQFVNYKTYKTERIKFLKSRLGNAGNADNGNRILFLINYIESYRPKIGIYAGSFNPLHIGHMNILQKAEKIFDKVIIAYGNNPDKKDRKIIIPDSLRFREVDTYNGLVTDYLSNVEKQGVEVTLIRGLRNGNDLNYESTQSQFIRDIKQDTNIVYFTCDKEFEHISSSAIRSLMKFGEEANKYIVK